MAALNVAIGRWRLHRLDFSSIVVAVVAVVAVVVADGVVD